MQTKVKVFAPNTYIHTNVTDRMEITGKALADKSHPGSIPRTHRVEEEN